jgi:PAS domain S-box-containing protein
MLINPENRLAMRWRQLFSLQDFSYAQKFLFITSEIVLLLLTWSGFLSFSDTSLSFLSILNLHTFPLVWFADLLILGLSFSFVVYYNLLKFKTNKHKKEIKELNQKIQLNIELANNLQNAQWDNLPEGGDILSQTLLKLGHNISISNKREEEHKWITTGKDQISELLRNSHNLEDLSIVVLKAMLTYMGGIQGAIYLAHGNILKRSAMYAYGRRRFEYNEIPVGKGLIGTAAYEKAIVFRSEIPEDYFSITSGLLGEQKPKSILLVPLLQEEDLQGVLEIAFLETRLPGFKTLFAEETGSIIGQTIFNLKITTRTEMLLKESQEKTATLKQNEDQLRHHAREMIATQEELERSNQLLESQIQEVANSQKKLEALLTNASEFISIYDENQQLVFESPSVKRILGYSDTDIINGMDPEVLTPRGLKTINQLFQYLLDTPGGEQTALYTYLRKNGEKLFLETKGKNLLHDPAIRGIIFNTQDITERKRAEKEERMKSRMQSLSENSPDMILRINMFGKLVYVNPAVASFIDLPSNELVKKRIPDLHIDPRFIEFMQDTLASIREDQHQIISEVAVNSQYGERIMEIKAIPEFGEEGELETILFVAHDMTEFKKIEQEIKEKNKKISDSINYAQRIQTSILPDTRLLQEFFPRSFIFYRPKDVVSGDFPWFFRKDNTYYIAAVDCTGHGVPGALISFIGHFLLNNIVSLDHHLAAAQILDNLHLEVRSTLRQDQEGATGRDGMDLALCKIDMDNQILEYAGAHRPLYFLRNGELTEYQGTRKGIGGIPLAKKVENDFENHVIHFQKGDQIFIFSDGLPDQLGGPERKKYQARRIRELLTEKTEASMAHFSRQFSMDFHDWLGDEKQVDDVLLIGIEL